MRLILFCLLWLPLQAFASVSMVYGYRAGYPSSPELASAAAACADAVSYRNGAGCPNKKPDGTCYTTYSLTSITTNSPTGGSCLLSPSSGSMGWTARLKCPENSTLSGGVCVCNTGSSQIGDSCVADATDDSCKDKAGTSDIVNITSGWKRTPSVGDPSESWVVTNKLPSGGQFSVCSPSTPGGTTGCKQDIDANEPCADCKGWVSQTPGNNGLYRVSTDFRGHYSGEACGASDSEVPPDLLTPDDSKDPPCPGYVGEVNGVKGCFGNAQKPVPSTDPNKPNNNGSDKGNPPAGNKPDSGPGSGSDGPGRTPDTGTGGSAGGPSGAAGGTKPDGTTNKPEEGKEQEACGAPGQPPCKIDETGTPKGEGEKGKFKEAADKAHDETKKLIDKAEKLKADGWTFTFQFPTGCTPMTLQAFGAMVIDPCQYQPIMHDLMSMIWIGAAVWCCIAMVGAALRGD